MPYPFSLGFAPVPLVSVLDLEQAIRPPELSPAAERLLQEVLADADAALDDLMERRVLAEPTEQGLRKLLAESMALPVETIDVAFVRAEARIAVTLSARALDLWAEGHHDVPLSAVVKHILAPRFPVDILITVEEPTPARGPSRSSSVRLASGAPIYVGGVQVGEIRDATFTFKDGTSVSLGQDYGPILGTEVSFTTVVPITNESARFFEALVPPPISPEALAAMKAFGDAIIFLCDPAMSRARVAMVSAWKPLELHPVGTVAALVSLTEGRLGEARIVPVTEIWHLLYALDIYQKRRGPRRPDHFGFMAARAAATLAFQEAGGTWGPEAAGAVDRYESEASR